MSPTMYAQRLAQLIEGTSGHVVCPNHYPFLAQIAEERARAWGFHLPEEYVLALERGALPEEWHHLLPRITVKESYLFRTPQHFDAISRVVVPALVQGRTASRRLRAWSAGCARGEEPATLAMVLAEHPNLVGWDWRIAATDIDPEAISAARRGIFNDRAVAQVPAALRQRYLTPCAGGWQLAPALQERIEYAVVNLIHEPLEMALAPFDLIMLRNVLIYFQPTSQRRVVNAVAALLARDGALFVGPAETLWQFTGALEPVDAGGCFYYRPASAALAAEPPPLHALPPLQPSLAEAQASPSGRPPGDAGQPCRAHVAVSPPGNPERLWRAVAAAGANRLDEAAHLVREAVLAAPRDPLAHALDGFLHDLLGRPQEAAASYRAALFLEPQLAQVRLLLAECLVRLGWRERGRREARQALISLSQRRAQEAAVLKALGVPAGEALQRRLGEVVGRTKTQPRGTLSP